MSYATPLGGDSQKGVPHFHHTWPHAFSFAYFIFYYFAVIKLCHEYNYMLSPLSPSSESLNLGVV